MFVHEVTNLLCYNTFIDVLNTHAPVTTKKVQANNHQCMTKALRKAIMTRSRLKMPTWKLEIVKTGKTTKNKEIFAQIYSNK